MKNENLTKMINAITKPSEGYKVLAYAIIVMAAYDYRKARREKDEYAMKTIERFFRGNRFSIYGRGVINGDFIIDGLIKESEEELNKILFGMGDGEERSEEDETD